MEVPREVSKTFFPEVAIVDYAHTPDALKNVLSTIRNITHDHLDFHKTFANYIQAKKGFFDALPATAFALTNIDDKNGMVMVQNTKATVKTYSLQSLADFKTRLIENSFEGLHLEINGTESFFRLSGRFNAYNLTAIYAAAVLLGKEGGNVS